MFSCTSKRKKNISPRNQSVQTLDEEQKPLTKEEMEEYHIRRDIETIVLEAVEVVIDNKDEGKISLYFSPSYLEYHGKTLISYDQFAKFIGSTSSIVPKRTIYRRAVDGNMVALYSQLQYENFVYSAIDFFEVKDNLIVARHSFSREESDPEVFSTITTVESNTEPTSTLLKTQQMYKQQVDLLYNDIFPNAKIEEIDNVFAYNFIHHRSDFPPEKQGIIDLLSLGPIVYNVKLIVVENNTAFVYLEDENASTAYAEILSFATDGLILESWAIPISMAK